MAKITRRGFVQGSAAAAIAWSLPSCVTGPRKPRRSPNEEIRVAVAGIRSRGTSHIQGFQRLPNVRVVALCDVDRTILDQRADEFEKRENLKVDRVVDYRELLDRDDIDAVSLATPNHWHALQSVWACEAGKDVYVEKPVSHNVWEGAQIVKAARRNGCIVQTGTQSRSSQGIDEAAEWVRAGNLGPILVARGLCYKPRESIGKVTADQVVPTSIDYDLWTGPAPMKPLRRKNIHYDWHWVFDTGNGDLGNQGIHQMDMCRWVLGENKMPTRVLAFGGRFGYDDDGNTPNTMVTVLQTETAPLVFEVRGLPRDQEAQQQNWRGGMDKYRGASIGAVIECEGGYLRITNYTSATAFDPEGKEVRRFEGATNHFQNFIDAMRSREVSDLNADIQEGHLSSAYCHLGNISYALGRDGARAQQRVLDQETMVALAKMGKHLKDNGVEGDQISFGTSMAFDPDSMRFTGRNEEKANELLTRDYREPFSFPTLS